MLATKVSVSVFPAAIVNVPHCSTASPKAGDVAAATAAPSLTIDVVDPKPKPDGSVSLMITLAIADAGVFCASIPYVAVPPAAAPGVVVRLTMRSPPADVVALALASAQPPQVALAVLTIDPAPPGITVTSTDRLPAGSMSPRVQVTQPAADEPPVEALTKVEAAGSTSVRT